MTNEKAPSVRLLAHAEETYQIAQKDIALERELRREMRRRMRHHARNKESRFNQ